MFWETFSSLCAKHSEAPNVVAKKLNISSGAVTFWKNGKVPHHSTLIKIAEYFDVSVDYLLGKETTLSSKLTLSPLEKSIIIAYRNHPELQAAVNKLLEIETSESEQPALSVRVAAKSGNDYNVHGTDEDTDPVVR